ncbi:UV radiation resistance-associated protein-like [Patiria miniata]|uniref:C2 domain-containing protein n=1 Tax=Patiria miniata TaxID=46514 RepID=A0A913ZJA3_PATMI|nr:UV radiation resistance-associated protein-like [Patiria miniata]
MSASDSAHRIQHTGLVTQQRRLRHLSSLSARNIVPTRREKESLMETYFTLHIWPSRETVYTSEKIHNSLNPTWRSFDLQMSCPNLDTSQSTILVRVWGGQTSDHSLVIEWLVDLRGLCYLGSQIHKDGVRYQPNSIIFGMFQGFYGAPDNLPDSKQIRSEFQVAIEVEQSAAMLSYKIFSLGRLHTTQRAIRQTEASVSKVRSSIVEKLTLVKDKTILRSEREALLLRLGVLKYEQEQQEQLLAADCKKCTKSRESIDEKVQDLRLRRERLRSGIDELKEQNQDYQEKKEQLQKLAAKYTARKTTLLGELSDIYPVVEQANHEYTILGIKLPNAERYSGTDDMVVSTGLGHTCHLILMMSQILKLPLRYPMVHYGSRSLVRDHITESLAEKDRDFPLYSRGKERFQFNYALYLLNRNIAQLRFAMGLQTTDLRATLPNLKTLLELKWGIKNNTVSTIYQAPRSLQQPDQSVASYQQQQQQLHQRPSLIRSTTSPPGVAPYPVQPPPVYSQVDLPHPPQVDARPPPPYQSVEVTETPPLSPYVEQNSPFEDLTPETESPMPVPTAPIAIPSVDIAAKAIEARQTMADQPDSEERIGQTTAVIETQVASLSLEDTLSDPRSTETLRPSMEYRDRDSTWPSDFVVVNSDCETLQTEPVAVQQIESDDQQCSLSSEVRKEEPNSQQNPLQERPLRTLVPDLEPQQVQESLNLPEFAPSGQLDKSEQPEPAASEAEAEPVARSSATNDRQASAANTNNHHNSRSEPKQISLLPDTTSEPTQSHSSTAKETSAQSPLQLATPQESQPSVAASHSAYHHSNTSVPNLDKVEPVGAPKPNLIQSADKSLFSDDVSLPRRSDAVGIPPRESNDTTVSMDTDAGYQFHDLGSRAEALSRQDSFSSFKKVSTSPNKGRKSGKRQMMES